MIFVRGPGGDGEHPDRHERAREIHQRLEGVRQEADRAVSRYATVLSAIVATAAAIESHANRTSEERLPGALDVRHHRRPPCRAQRAESAESRNHG